VQCSQKFSLVGDDRPQELTIDEDTGVLSMLVDSAVKGSYLVDVEIVTSDGTNDDRKQVQMRVNAVCCESSTTLTPPSMAQQCQATTLIAESSLPHQGTFVSSNPTCPVVSHALLFGNQQFGGAYHYLTSGAFSSTPGTGFEVKLWHTEDQLGYQRYATVNTTYYYAVRASAEGGSTATTVGRTIVGKPRVLPFTQQWTFPVTEAGSRVELFPQSSTEYITGPQHGFRQTFTYRMRDDSENPKELAIDPDTGIFRLVVRSTKAAYAVQIVILTTDDCDAELRHDSCTTTDYVDVTISTVCGQGSTRLTAYGMQDLTKHCTVEGQLCLEEAYWLSSNPTCPVMSVTKYDYTNGGNMQNNFFTWTRGADT